MFGVSSFCVLGVRGPGLVTVDETYKCEVPVMSRRSTMTLVEKVRHVDWKYLIFPLSTSVVVLSPGSIMAGAENSN